MRRTNLAIERHASRIYTRAMYEEFRRLVTEATAYNVTENREDEEISCSPQQCSQERKMEQIEYEVNINDDQ